MRKHKAVRSWIQTHKPSFGYLLETRVQEDHCPAIIESVFPGWKSLTNYEHHRLGRIWFIWSDLVTVTPLYKGSQIITARITTSSGEDFVASGVYASNFFNDRLLLWKEIQQTRDLFVDRNTPWVVLGDFNQILTSQDHSRAHDHRGEHVGMRDFQILVSDCDLTDLTYTGPHYTWWNNREAEPIGKKLDRVLVNETWNQRFSHSFAVFEANGISDHTRCKVNIMHPVYEKKNHFKFFNYLTELPQFYELISSIWLNTEPLFHSRSALHRFHKKLKMLKQPLRNLNKDRYGDISKLVREALQNLCHAQERALQHPDSTSFAAASEATVAWNHYANIEEKIFQQKSRITWLKNGDHNTPFFHRAVRARVASNNVKKLITSDGLEIYDSNRIKEEATRFFCNLLQRPSDVPPHLSQPGLLNLISYRCSPQSADALTSLITTEEIKSALFSMPSNKSPGPDGFTSEFFIASWPILGRDFTVAVQSFFIYGFMPRGVNATTLALIPKKAAAETLGDFRPIACCNTIYKVISKVLANRLKTILPEAIEKNQCAFVKNRILLENVLLATELVKDYHKPHISPRCVLKLDISKAFDTIRWDFIINTLHAMGIPDLFIFWIKGCISTAAFSVSINGELDGFFTSTRGLRQGCSLSPYLFVIAINVLSLKLKAASDEGIIGFHPYCQSLSLNHLSFADDLMVFMDGTVESLQGTMGVLNDFERISGLSINTAKSSIYAAGRTVASLHSAATDLGIKMDHLPICYLGLPLTTKSMSKQDYEPLVEKIRNRLLSWSTKVLSYAGRLQLIQSVIKNVTNFWCSVFRLPNRCFRAIDSMCAAFLWSGSPHITSKSKIAWHEVCVPKAEGGLGIRKMCDTSRTFSLSLIWRLFENAGSLWVAWVNHYLLRHSSFWDAIPNSRGSWVWRKLLKLKDTAKLFITKKICSGENTFFWSDHWTGSASLLDVLGDSSIKQLGIPRNAKVSDVGSPQGWNFRRCRDPRINDVLQQITNMHPPNPLAGSDVTCWKHGDQDYRPCFSSKQTWNQIRIRLPKVPWRSLVWFPQSLPRQAFITWLAIKNKLATGDRTQVWGQLLPCTLCGERNETRDHLFFACPYSYTVWSTLCARLHRTDPDWHTSLASLHRQPLNASDRILARMLFQASVYHIWRERNNRRHTLKQSSSSLLISKIRIEISFRIKSFPIDSTPALVARWQALNT